MATPDSRDPLLQSADRHLKLALFGVVETAVVILLSIFTLPAVALLAVTVPITFAETTLGIKDMRRFANKNTVTNR